MSMKKKGGFKFNTDAFEAIYESAPALHSVSAIDKGQPADFRHVSEYERINGSKVGGRD
ncbi:hypothetical protein MCEGE14_01633 [Burkholderiaceae bacterium]